MKLRRYAVSTAMVFVVGLLAPLSTQAEEQNGLELLTGTDTPLREKDRISFWEVFRTSLTITLQILTIWLIVDRAIND